MNVQIIQQNNPFFSNELFSLQVFQSRRATRITMRLLTSIVSTEFIPSTFSTLEKYLPNTLRTKCFNENNYTFAEEVKKTEVGHLFEHILLQYLWELKVKQGFDDVIFNGLTEWNWRRDDRGVFQILLDVGSHDREIFLQALDKSIILITKILNSKIAEL